MGLGDNTLVGVAVIILGFFAVIQAMLGNWVGAAIGLVIMGTVIYTRLIRPARPRR